MERSYSQYGPHDASALGVTLCPSHATILTEQLLHCVRRTPPRQLRAMGLLGSASILESPIQLGLSTTKLRPIAVR